MVKFVMVSIVQSKHKGTINVRLQESCSNTLVDVEMRQTSELLDVPNNYSLKRALVN